jgi:UDP-N-acetyl-D-glucosamine/UDP-N-acetyl-D-galactosamine dehydrogenase
MITFESLIARTEKIAVVGLGYVGLPLAVHLAEHFDVVGFDLKTQRIKELISGVDRTLEVARDELAAASLSRLRFQV